MKTYSIKSYLGEVIKTGISRESWAILNARVFSYRSLVGNYASVWEDDGVNPPSCIGHAERGYWNSNQGDIRQSV